MADDTTHKGRGLLLRITVFVAVPLLVIVIGGWFYAKGGRYVETENAYVKADIVHIGTNVEGLITEVFVTDNQVVAKGDPLFAIDPRPFEKQLALAEADLEAARQRVEALRAEYRSGQQTLTVRREQIRYLQIEYKRQKDLLDKGHGTQAKFEEVEHDLSLARRELAVAEEDNRMVLAQLTGNPDLPAEAHPAFRRAEAARQRAELDLAYTRVVAPSDGVLAEVSLEPGEYVEEGDKLMAIVGTDRLWVEANLKEVDLTYVRAGQTATVVLDSLPDVVWQASVDSISPATGAQFSVLPPQNATGNWVKVVQRVPVRLILTERPGSEILRAGLTARVSIDTERRRDLVAIARQVLAMPPAAEAQ